MKLFIVGFSKTGKTTSCKKLAEAFPEITHVQSSTWVKLAAPQLAAEDDDAYRHRLVAKSNELTAIKPDICINYVKNCLPKDVTGPRVLAAIEGIRNPRDIAALLAPEDKVVFVRSNHITPHTTYEADGNSAIHTMVRFLYTHCGYTPSHYTYDKQDLLNYLMHFTKERNI